MRKLILILVLLTLLVPLAYAHGAQSRTYNASLGASYGFEGVSSNRVSGPGVFTTTHAHHGVRVTLTDTADLDPFIAACVDLNGNGFCDDAEGDLLFEGHSMIEGWSSTPFNEVILFSDALNYDPDTGAAHASTRGTVRVEWLDGAEEPTQPPARERDAIEQLLHDVILLVFGATA